MSRILSAFFFLLVILAVPGNAQLISGQPITFNLTAPGLNNGGAGYFFTVPAGATRLEVRMAAASCDAEISLYVRYGVDVTQDATGIQADVVGAGPAGNKIVVVGPGSSIPLREGIYYIALLLGSGGGPTSGTVTATLDSQNSTPQTLLSSGITTPYSFGCVDTPSLLNGPYSYRVNVPPGSTNVQVKLTTDTLNARVDLYVRAGSDVINITTFDQRVASTDNPKTLNFTPAPSAQPTTYFIALRLVSLDVAVTGTITATVTSPAPVTPPAIGVSITTLTFNTPFGANPPAQSFTVRNTGGGTLNFRISSNVTWLGFSQTTGSSTGAAFTITVNVNVGGLSPGSVTGQITVSDQGTPAAAPVVISVTLVVSLGGVPVINAPSTLDFGTVTVGQSKSLTLTISNNGSGVLTVSSLTLSGSQFAVAAPATPITMMDHTQVSFPVTFSPATAGAQAATLTIGSDDPGRRAITVSLVGVGLVSGGPTIAASVTSLVFTGQVGGTLAPQTFTVRNSGTGTLSYQVTTSQSWVAVTPTLGTLIPNGPTMITHTVSINTAGLAAGTLDAQIRLAQAGTGLSPESGPAQVTPVVIAVKLILSGQPPAVPTITANSLVNAASFKSPALPGGSLARGGIFTMFGNGIGPATLATASAFPLPTSLAGASVKVTKGSTSVDAIPLAVVATQINAILPSNAPLGDVQVTVTFNGQTSAPVAAQVVDSAFGLFTVNQNGMGPGIFQNFVSQTETPLNSPQRPAKPSRTLQAMLASPGSRSTAGSAPRKAAGLPNSAAIPRRLIHCQCG